MAKRSLSHDDYSVGWICARPIEMAVARSILDEEHTYPLVTSDNPTEQKASSSGEPGPAESERQSKTTANKMATSARDHKYRTNTGCLTCRRWRIKCGEEKPGCNNCIKAKRYCEGYTQRVIFKNALEPLGATYDSGLPANLQTPATLFPRQQQLQQNHNIYTLGRIGTHNVVIALLGLRFSGTALETAATQLLSSFHSIDIYLLVGIGGGLSNKHADIRLGDVVVGTPRGEYGGIVQYDYDKSLIGPFEKKGILNRPPHSILTTISKLQANSLAGNSQVQAYLSEMKEKFGRGASRFMVPDEEDRLYETDYEHIMEGETCELCDKNRLVSRAPRTTSEPEIHYGLIASGNRVVMDSHLRDRLGREFEILCVETEAAVLMNEYPGLVIRGICDYADSHRNTLWQDYAAAVAASYAKELLVKLPRRIKRPEQPAFESLKDPSTFFETFASSNLASVLDVGAETYNLNWRSSIVDLLVLLDIDHTLAHRHYLAQILDVHAGHPGSSVQNMALHNAVLQEFAKNKGQIPDKLRSQRHLNEADSKESLNVESHSGTVMNQVQTFSEFNKIASFDSELRQERHHSDHFFVTGEDDIGEGEIQVSPMNKTKNNKIEHRRRASEMRESDTILDSTNTGVSNTFYEKPEVSVRFSSAEEEFAYVLYKNERMGPLFQSAQVMDFEEELITKFRRMLSHYGLNLQKEASSRPESTAAKFVHRSAGETANHILRIIKLQADHSRLILPRQEDDFGEFLQNITKVGIKLDLETNGKNHESPSDSDSNNTTKENDIAVETLHEVHNFLTTANAFETLHHEFQQWLTAGELSRHNSEDTGKAINTSAVSLQIPSDEIFQRTWFLWIKALIYRVQPLFWPRPPLGFKRITWHSALGRPLYIDVKETVRGAAGRLQLRFRSPGKQGTTGASDSSFREPVHLRPPTVPLPVHSNSRPLDSTTSNEVQDTERQASDTDSSLLSIDKRFLLLCFSTQKSETFKQVDVTGLDNDQLMFSRIHGMYCEVKNEESWYNMSRFVKSSLPSWFNSLFGELHFYTPKGVNFISFTLLPLWQLPSPVNIKCPSLPPEHEVTILRNWHYHPCPREVEEFRIPETTAACLLEPGHAFPDDVWLELFPKKLHHSLAYESGTVTVAWGIQIVEGLNLAVIIWLLLLIFLFSALMAVLYSVITRDVAGAFTISAWLMGTSTLFTIYVQLRR